MLPGPIFADWSPVQRMPLSDDVVRGLRWGAILLAGLAIGVAGYRLMQESPAKPASISPAVEKPVIAVPEKVVAKPENNRPAPATGSNTVPPPPPARSR